MENTLSSKQVVYVVVNGEVVEVKRSMPKMAEVVEGGRSY
jgi:hypothetical protein